MNEDPVRVTLRIPPGPLADFKGVVRSLGYKRMNTDFYGLAFLLGMRILCRQLSPTEFSDSAVIDAQADEFRALVAELMQAKKK